MDSEADWEKKKTKTFVLSTFVAAFLTWTQAQVREKVLDDKDSSQILAAPSEFWENTEKAK